MCDTKECSINKKWMEASISTFKESKNKEGKRELILETMIVPFGETSRNGVLYNKESVIKTHKMLEGKTLNHNHITTGAEVLPRGKWMETWIQDDGMYGKAKVFDTKYNESYIEWLQADESPRVSLQISGSAKQFKEESTGKWKREATITDWLESSTVNLPGFNKASGSLSVAMAEAFDGEEMEISEAMYSFWNPINDNIKKLKQAIKNKNKNLAKSLANQIAMDFKGIQWDKEIKEAFDGEEMKEFSVGDRVKVTKGANRGERGIILEPTPNARNTWKVDFNDGGTDDVFEKDLKKENVEPEFFEQLDKIREGLRTSVRKRMDGLIDQKDLKQLKRAFIDIKLDLGKEEFELNDIDEYIRNILHL